MELEFVKVSGTGKGFRLKDISFKAENGFITGLVGENGAGKTTLFHLIMDEAAKYEGTILVDGKPLRENHKELLQHIGFVSEEQPFFMEKSALENEKLYAQVYRIFDEERFAAAMKQMGVSTGKVIGKMSRGEFLKFQVAFAIAHDTKLFLLDEVTAGMDPIFRKEFFKMLHDIIAGEDTAILMSTHIEEEIAQHMDYVGRLQEGKMVAFGEV